MAGRVFWSSPLPPSIFFEGDRAHNASAAVSYIAPGHAPGDPIVIGGEIFNDLQELLSFAVSRPDFLARYRPLVRRWLGDLIGDDEPSLPSP